MVKRANLSSTVAKDSSDCCPICGMPRACQSKICDSCIRHIIRISKEQKSQSATIIVRLLRVRES